MLPLIAALALFSPLQADVLRVAPDGSGTHLDIEAALTFAAPGDIILVDPSVVIGSSADFVSINKSVTIIGDGPERVAMPVTIVNSIPADGQVVLRNLAFRPTLTSVLLGGSLWVRESAGAVLIEDCQMHGWEESVQPDSEGGIGMTVTNSSAVSVVRSSIRGGQGITTSNDQLVVVDDTGEGGIGLRLTNSDISVHHTTVVGGAGGDDSLFGVRGGGGALGLRAQNSRVWLIGSEVQGGAGGVGTPNGPNAPGAQTTGPATHLRRLDSSLTGAGEMPGLEQNGGLITEWDGGAIEFALSSPVRPAEMANARVSGPAGTVFGVYLSFGLGFFPKENFHGVVVAELSSFSGPLFIDAIPAGGEFNFDFVVPAFGLDGYLNVDQVFTTQGVDGVILSNGSAWVQVENGL